MGGSVGSNGRAGGGGGAGYYGGGGGTVFDTGGAGGGGSDFCATSLSSPLSLTNCAVIGTTPIFGASVSISYTGPSDLAATLVTDVDRLKPGRLGSLARRIQTAVNAGNTATACAGIANFLGVVEVQTGKKLTQAQATLLTTDATNLATALDCS